MTCHPSNPAEGRQASVGVGVGRGSSVGVGVLVGKGAAVGFGPLVGMGASVAAMTVDGVGAEAPFGWEFPAAAAFGIRVAVGT